MTGIVLAITSTIFSGLIVTMLVSWVRKPTLVVLVPRMFSHSPLTGGQLVELTVFNRGFKTEEAIDVTLNHTLRYEIVGSNSQYATVTENRIHITRVGPSDEVTVLLLVENGSFKQNDIVQCLSRVTEGKIVSNLAEVSPTGSQRMKLVVMACAIPVIFLAVTFGVEYLLNPPISGVKTVTEPDGRDILEVDGWKVPAFYKIASPRLLKSFSDKKISAILGKVVRQGDIVSVPVLIQNETDLVFNVSLSMNTPASSKQFQSFELSAHDIVIFPGRSEERVIKVVAPENATDRLERTVFIQIFLKTEGDSLLLARRHLLPQFQ